MLCITVFTKEKQKGWTSVQFETLALNLSIDLFIFSMAPSNIPEALQPFLSPGRR